MIVDYLDIECIAAFQPKTQSPLVVDTHAILAFTITVKLFQPIARRSLHVVKPCCQIELFELSQGRTLNGNPAAHPTPLEKSSRVVVTKALYHPPIITLRVITRKWRD